MVDFILPKKPTRIWDLHVPIAHDKERKVTDVYLTESIEEPAEYNELCYRLAAAEDGEVFNLHLNTPGGMVDSAFMIVDAIKRSKATVVGHLSGTVASAGTIISMACDNLVVADHISFMIHNYSAGMSGKGHEMKARQKFMDDSLNEAFKTFYKGFLSDDEMQRIIEGQDLWIGKDEVLERWDNRISTAKGTAGEA